MGVIRHNNSKSSDGDNIRQLFEHNCKLLDGVQRCATTTTSKTTTIITASNRIKWAPIACRLSLPLWSLLMLLLLLSL